MELISETPVLNDKHQDKFLDLVQCMQAFMLTIDSSTVKYDWQMAHSTVHVRNTIHSRYGRQVQFS